MISERSIYRLIDAGLISAKNIDLPRKVRFRVRKKKKELKVDKKCRIGRTFDLFQKFMEEHPDIRFHITSGDTRDLIKTSLKNIGQFDCEGCKALTLPLYLLWNWQQYCE